jgi:hypothetical protein
MHISVWEPAAKAKTAEDDHTANSLTVSAVPTQAVYCTYSKASNTVATAWFIPRSPEEQLSSEKCRENSYKTELKLHPDHIIYTDGHFLFEQEENPTYRFCFGSGVYRQHKHAHLSLRLEAQGAVM